MEIYCINRRCAAFCTEPGEILSITQAEETVKKLLKDSKIDNWPCINIDVFCSDEKMLYLAYPGDELKITIAPYALPFIAEYFT